MIAKILPAGHPEIKDPKHPVRYFDIRKLTEGECLKLMDVPDDMIKKLRTTTKQEYGELVGADIKGDEKVLSKSALYKLAGNSIVVSCLREIFENIYLTKDDPDEQFDLFPEPTFRAPIPEKIKMVTLCSGYDSQMIALRQVAEKAGCDCELVAWAEFDPENKAELSKQPAVIAHNILFPEYKDRNVGDMTKADWGGYKNEEIDILT